MEPIESIREKLAEPKGSAAFENWYENPAAQPQRYLEAVRCFEKAFGTGRRAALFLQKDFRSITRIILEDKFLVILADYVCISKMVFSP